MYKQTQTVFVAMSGGVDSSVAAALLWRRGFDVVGVHFKCWNVDGPSTSLGASCAADDAEDARRAAETIGIPFYAMDFEREYRKAVVRYMVDGYRRGLTPNPDVMCNKEIKFGLFLKKALEMGADYVATGHYVKKIQNPRLAGRQAKSKIQKLFVAKDTNKDQSYFLWTLTQAQLRRCLFPIGEYIKPQVRAMARRFGLPNAEKKDSQGICFLGKVSLRDFLGQFIPSREGVVMNTAGKEVGKHRGAAFYTIGQRHGFAVATNSKQEETKPHYIVAKDVRTNTLTVAEGDDNPALYRKRIRLVNVNLINRLTDSPITVYARLRYRQPLAKATLAVNGKRHISLVFDAPQKFVAPGQSAVFYSLRGELLGGGIIMPYNEERLWQKRKEGHTKRSWSAPGRPHGPRRFFLRAPE